MRQNYDLDTLNPILEQGVTITLPKAFNWGYISIYMCVRIARDMGFYLLTLEPQFAICFGQHFVFGFWCQCLNVKSSLTLMFGRQHV